ncbi:hypothetical protein PPUJ20005_38190 [Pseudomonas putida]|uniref:hypothetical protein n=1 Tax=Pseudomonas putida TaxID=303 RepID=UPI00235CFF6E|nr:hypothetical protein [Pseudomonas putida]GLO09850.1 hypothetical protein PPUJ20005_38190 [Pseudomonas putida]HDS0987062.1 hypothetical protein [Pseudomonas putida]
MLVVFELNHNDREALLRHCQSFIPTSDDSRENRRLADALSALAEALDQSEGESDTSSRA